MHRKAHLAGGKGFCAPMLPLPLESALVQFWMKVYLADKCQNLQTLDKYGYNTESYTHNMNYLIAKNRVDYNDEKTTWD
jgi:hypothetical protein